MANVHPTRYLRDPLDGRRVAVDRDLADVIVECWRLGFDTVSCCQDVGESAGTPALQERAFIEFDTAPETGRFLTVLANAGPMDDFYERMTNGRAPGAWRKSVHFTDFRRHRTGAAFIAPWISSAQFPVSDIGEILARLRRTGQSQE